MRRAVITGAGIVSSLGNTPADAYGRLKTLRNCVEASEDLTTYKGLQTCLWAPSKYERPERYTRKVVRTMGPVSEMSLFATEQALEAAGLSGDPEIKGGRLGIAYGSCSGSVAANADFATVLLNRELKNVTSSTYIKMMPQTCAVNLSVHFGTTGRIIPTGTACTSGSLAIGFAAEAIRSGAQDIMIAGGAEEFSVTQVAVFDTLFATSRKNSTPELTPRAFDRARDGLVIGDGAATLIIEEREHAIARGAKILAEIAGFGTNTDGRHVTQPNPETMGEAMRLALEDARLSPEDIGYVNAHGTATALGDVAEGQAMIKAFGAARPPVSTVKSYTGHTLGACGAIEAILSIEMMNRGWFAPNLNLENPDPECGDHDFIMGDGRKIETGHVMSNNFAFGGVNTSLIFSRA
ncbi:MAG: beta-ketoacyl-ACP synthase [Kiritimatiellae bacterium]|nr:beta-ketoacyl-ACP synthase [Kiritimatiellia bacterium]